MASHKGWPTSVRELTEEDMAALAGVDNPTCGWEGCTRDARWEVMYESLLDTEDLARFELGLKIEMTRKNLPASELVSWHQVRAYCDEHARRFCLEGNLELPAMLAD
jgi:hypothetical protein